MAKSWRDYLSDDAEDVGANRAIRAVRSCPDDLSAPIGTNGTGLSPEIRRGLVRLENAPVPAKVDHERWPQVVSDARTISADGWAAKALALGWSPLDLFGASMSVSEYGDGLAAWMRGRELLALAETWAVVRDTHGNRFFFNRPREPGSQFLWSLGG